MLPYASIKDKNGKDVYEGDIFEAPHDFGPAGFEKRIATCGWCGDLARGYQWQSWLLEELEVLGNRYENPDMFANICPKGGFHEYRTDEQHQNEICGKCFKSKEVRSGQCNSRVQ